jgi:hypothetical protein
MNSPVAHYAFGLQPRPEIRLAYIDHQELIGRDVIDARDLRDQVLAAQKPVTK